MLATSKLFLTFLCFVCTLFLYSYDHFSTSSSDYAVAPLDTSEAIIFDVQPSKPQNALSPGSPPAAAAFDPKTLNHTSNIFKDKRPRILQATMMFGDTYSGLNERMLQSHIDHAKRWGYEDHTLRREIVGANQWDKFMFSKILHVLSLIVEELKRPTEERAEWVVWYDADTLILNPNVHWEIFLPPDTIPDIHFMATKNLDGFNAGLFFFRVHEWSAELLSDAYSLPRLRPEVRIAGNIEQNALKYLFDQEPNKRHVVYQPQLWYNGFKGTERAETEINGGDMLVHFAGINHKDQGQMKEQVMSRWFSKIEQQPDKWQVPLEKTKYPGEIEAFWRTYKEAREMVDKVRVRSDIQPQPYQDVRRARDNLRRAIEEQAFDAPRLKICMQDMTQALEAAKESQEAAGSGGYAEQ